MAELDWNDLRYLLALAETRTLTVAGKRLGVSQPTVGRRLAALEEAVGTRLFVRMRSGYALTAEGAMLRDVAAELSRRVSELEHGVLRGTSVAGLVRIGVTEFVGHELMELAIPKLRAQYPDLELEMVTGNAPADLASGEVDIAIRLVIPEGSRLVARKLGRQHYAVYGAHAYLKRQGLPDRLDDLSSHTFLWPVHELAKGPDSAWLNGLNPRPRVSLQLNSLPILIKAAEAGFGLAVLPEQVGEVRGSLRNVFALPRTVVRELYLVQHEDSRTVPRVRVVADAVADTITRLLGSRQK